MEKTEAEDLVLEQVIHREMDALELLMEAITNKIKRVTDHAITKMVMANAVLMAEVIADSTAKIKADIALATMADKVVSAIINLTVITRVVITIQIVNTVKRNKLSIKNSL